MTRRTLLRRVHGVAETGGERWRTRPAPPELRWDVLTAGECEAAARVRDRLDAVGLSGISNAELDFSLCLHERLAGQRDAPCLLGAE